MKRSLILTVFSFLMLAQLGWGQVPQTISYQGVLRHPDGTLAPAAGGDTTATITFSLYDAATPTLPVWTETQSVLVSDGLFSVILGKATPFTGIENPPVELGIKVGADAEMIPRVELTSVIYALHADRSDTSEYAQKAEEVSGADNVFPGSGNVGIGTTNPSAKLDVVGDANIQGNLVADGLLGVGTSPNTDFTADISTSTIASYGLRVSQNYSGTSTKYGLYSSVTSDGTGPKYGLRTDVTAYPSSGYDVVGNYASINHNGSSSPVYGSRVIIEGTPGTGVQYGYTSHGEDRNSFYGAVLIGVDTDPSPYKLYVIGQGGATSGFVSVSDARLKSNIRPLNHALDTVTKLRGVSYQWNEASEAMGLTPGSRDIGVIAQELEHVLPELVTTAEDDGYKAVAYEKLTAVLIEAVKELKAEKDALERRVAALETVLAEKAGSVTTAAALVPQNAVALVPQNAVAP